MAKRRDYKAIRVILQLLALIGVAGWVAHILAARGFPATPDRDAWVQREGFVAVSFGGLARTDGGTLLSRHAFRSQLEALRRAGFTAITTGDVVAFYEKGAPLPDRAVYLMFEGGRKDSAIFGQEALSATGFRATMFFPTSQLRMLTRTFMSASEAGSLASNPFWGAGSQGHEIYLTDGRPAGERAYYLNDFRRDSTGKAIETPEQFAARAEKDLSESRDMLAQLAGYPPAAFIFTPANSLGNSQEPALEAVNSALIKKYYPLCFTREGPAYNSGRSDPDRLSRMRVRPGTTAEELLARLEMWLPSYRPYVYRFDAPAERWQADQGSFERRTDGLALLPDPRHGSFAWLVGSDYWRDLDLSMVLPDTGTTFSNLYLRHVSREHFLRVRREGDTLLVQERLPDEGLQTLFSHALDPGPARMRLTLKNNRLWLAVNRENLTPDPLPLDRGPAAGKVALGLDGDAPDMLPRVFRDIAVNPIREYWRPISPEDVASGFAEWPENLSTTGLVIDLGGWTDERERDFSRALLQAASAGVQVFAGLPDGTSDLEAAAEKAASLPPALRSALWAGVVIAPSEPVDWANVARLAERAGRKGWKAAARLTAAQAARLGALERPPPLQYLLLPAEGEMSRQTLSSLRRHYGTMFFRTGEGWSETRQ